MEEAGPFLGILMLDTAFPRPMGDIGNEATFPFPVRKRIINGAFPAELVSEDPTGWITPFIAAACALERQGARLITTSCGFLAPFQSALEAALGVPVLASALFLHAPLDRQLEAEKRPGILTISAKSLTNRHLEAAAIPADAIIHGMPESSTFRRSILENQTSLDTDMAQVELVTAARTMQASHPELGAIVLECTNMPPYAAAISDATGLPVFSILDGIDCLWAGGSLETMFKPEPGAVSDSQAIASPAQ